jgi:hypothetical protein
MERYAYGVSRPYLRTRRCKRPASRDPRPLPSPGIRKDYGVMLTADNRGVSVGQIADFLRSEAKSYALAIAA